MPSGVQAFGVSRSFRNLFNVDARAAPALFCVFVLSACAGPEKTFRDAHDVVTEVIYLTADARDPSDAESLYALEERVEAACRPMFKSAHRQWVFGDIPFSARWESLLSTFQCRKSVDEARRLLDAYHLQWGTAPGVPPQEGAAVY